MILRRRFSINMIIIFNKMKLKNPWWCRSNKLFSMDQAPVSNIVDPQSHPQLDISKFDIRVGLITSVIKHPDADTLYIETIDLNESTGPRQILSGLVKYLKEEDLLNQRVLVCCNLKPAKMRGINSFGMLLAADKQVDGEEKVSLVQAPIDAPLGERISVEGFTDRPPQVQIDGKKADAQLFVEVFKELKSDANGVACYKGIPLMTSKGPCTCPFTDAPIH